MATKAPPLGHIGIRQDLLIRQGATWGPYAIPFRGPRPDPATPGEPIDLTGCTLRAQIRRTALDGAVLATLETPIVDPLVPPQASIGLTAAATAAIPCGEDLTDEDSKAVWDLELVDSTGRVIPIAYGAVGIFREVTRTEVTP